MACGTAEAEVEGIGSSRADRPRSAGPCLPLLSCFKGSLSTRFTVRELTNPIFGWGRCRDWALVFGTLWDGSEFLELELGVQVSACINARRSPPTRSLTAAIFGRFAGTNAQDSFIIGHIFLAMDSKPFKGWSLAAGIPPFPMRFACVKTLGCL